MVYLIAVSNSGTVREYVKDSTTIRSVCQKYGFDTSSRLLIVNGKYYSKARLDDMSEACDPDEVLDRTVGKETILRDNGERMCVVACYHGCTNGW